MPMKKKQGFNLVELLVVIAIIGLLSTLAVVALGTARTKSRDAKRVADIKQVQTALELFYTDNNAYPTATSTVLGQAGALCLGSSGFGATGCANPYMSLVPKNPSPGGAAYTYDSADGTTYATTFTLEGATGQLAAGAHTAKPGGIE